MSNEQIVLASYIQSGMVLQQKVPFVLEGRAKAGITLDLELQRSAPEGEQKRFGTTQTGVIHRDSTVAAEDGRFSFRLPPLETSFTPLSLMIRALMPELRDEAYIRAPGKSKPLPDIVVIDDILVGEVWVSGGQDNMVLPLTAADEGNHRQLLDTNDHVRFFLQDEEGKSEDDAFSYHPVDRVSHGRWTRAGRIIDLRQISAVAAWFAYDLNRRLRVPVGIISTEVNASLIHSWIKREELMKSQIAVKHLERIGLDRDEETWSETGEDARFQPSVFYNHKIAPLKGLTCRGYLWYQGESDIAFPTYYQEALPLLLSSWQQIFMHPKGSKPAFIYTQLAPYHYASLKPDALPKFNLMLSRLREELGVPAALIATHDLPLDYDRLPEDWKHPLHPQVKRPIGERMAAAALGMVYQQKAPPTSPEVQQIKPVGDKLMLSFLHTFSNLRLRGQETTLRGFQIAGEDKRFQPAEARLLYGVQVMLWHPDIKKPVHVQYAMQALNHEANLITEDNMAVLPYTTLEDGPQIMPDMSLLNLDNLTLWAYPPVKKPEPLPEVAAWLSRYRSTPGVKLHYRLERANHLEGEAATGIRYESDRPEFRILVQDQRYASLRPAFDLAGYKRLSIRVFNMDAWEKELRLAGQETWVKLEARLAWQQLDFLIEDGTDTSAFYFDLRDRRREGEILVDQIQLWRDLAID